MPMYTLPYMTELTNHLGTSPIDDVVDSLHCFITAFLFAASAMFISIQTYSGSPLECWLPPTYSREWSAYAEAYCFLKDTYWYPSDAYLEDLTDEHREQYRISYYQWSGMYFTFACALCVFPKLVWKFTQNYTIVSLCLLCEAAKKIHNIDQRQEDIRNLATFLCRRLRFRRMMDWTDNIPVVCAYFFAKLLYLSFAIGQLYLLTAFVGQGTDVFWGWKLFDNLRNDITWEKTGVFPRVTFCDFETRELAGHNREESLECLLGINEFNEKIFLFLWFWLLLLIIVSCLGIIFDIYVLHSNTLVFSLLYTIRNKGDKLQKKGFKDFVDYFLGRDGRLIFRVIKKQSEKVAKELALEMYDMYEEEMELLYSNLCDRIEVGK